MTGPMSSTDTLWLEVLERSLSDALEGPGAQELRDYVFCVRRDAEEWLLSDNDEPGAFLWVCHRLGIDARAVRGKYRERKERLEARRAEVKVRKAKWDRAQTARKHAELESA